MNQELNLAHNMYVDRDAQGVARQLLHTNEPVVISAASPQLAAISYLQRYGELLGIPSEQLRRLDEPPANRLENTSVEYRFLDEKHQFDSATVAYYQTVHGIPVWQAGLAVQMRKDPFRVLSSQSTRHPDLEVKPPSPDQLKQVQSMSEEELRRLLGLERQQEDRFAWESESLTIERRGLVVYRYEKEKRVPSAPPPAAPPVIGIIGREQNTTLIPELPTLPLPPVKDNIREGQHYICVRFDFALQSRSIGLVHWVVLVEVESQSVLYLRAFLDHVNGMVFDIDPVTTNGGPLPSANSAGLDPVRVSEALPGLVAPVANTQSLTGDNVRLSDVETPTIAPPTEPAGTDFNFGSRTDNFAAVNAYHHSDKFFRVADGMGFTRAGYFGATSFPSPVDHRGLGGNVINAHCLGGTGGAGIMQTAFALADTGDTTNPIGIACDYRVVLHELAGHGVLYNHVNSANFGFSHSAGDGVAAILNDPGSQATDRFQTFPWMYAVVNRRHDRTPAGGWGYAGNIALNPFSGTYDGGGYNNEQILSSTHFRIYQAIGGDSADLAAKQFAARVAVYLILRAIGSLTPATNPLNASGWVTALMTADAGDWVTENITGGAYTKVIRWAFEKQGLYQPAGAATPNNNPGVPPAVDVYIDDGRAGEYQYQPNWWSCQSIWNRILNDNGTTHETPITNQVNYAYVKVKNRGSQLAAGVVVKAFHANPAAGLAYPIDWTPMITPQLSAANVPGNNGAEITVGPFQWIPTHVGHECIFMIASATGDASNVNNIAAGDSIPEWRLVPNDNNIGQRNVYPVSGGGTSGLTADFNRFTFELKNPHLITAEMEVRTVLPSFLDRRGWRVTYEGSEKGSFILAPKESRQLEIKLIPGAEFTRADVLASPENTIHLFGYAAGIRVGGMSYVVDPDLGPPQTDGSHDQDKCAGIGGELLKCANLSQQKISRIRVRKISVDLEFQCDDDDCCE